MIKIVVVIALLAFTQGFITFKEFKDKYSKHYQTEEEELYRQAIYNVNLGEMEQENGKNLGYTLDVNEWSDISDEQFQAIVRSPPPKNLTFEPFVSSNLKVNAEASVDWRLHCAVTQVKNQGSCGSCWAFSTVADSQSYLYLTGGNTYDLSQEYVLECTDGSDCSGGVPADAMSLIISTGVPLEADYPYTASSLTSGKPSTSGICTSNGHITLPSGTAYRANNDVSFSNMKQLLSISPVVVYFWAPSSFMKYSSGVYSCSRAANYNDLNHGVQVIGYDSSGNYIIKNSWGATWGENGYGYVSSSTSKDCGVHLIVLSYYGANLTYSTANNCTVPSYDDASKLLIPVILMLVLVI